MNREALYPPSKLAGTEFSRIVEIASHDPRGDDGHVPAVKSGPKAQETAI